MSRAYRIKVRESLRRLLREKDKVGTELELLDILPPEQMAGLLKEQLLQREFEEEGNVLVRRREGITVTVDPDAGAITVQSERCQQLDLEAERIGRGYREDDTNTDKLKQELQKEVRESLEEKAKEEQERLQQQVANELESQLGDLKRELDQVVNRVTAEALKRKAALLGSIKEMSEDEEAGTLTIVLEV